jgi:DNA repair protein RadC
MARQGYTPLLTVKRSTQPSRLPQIMVSDPRTAADAVRKLVGDNAYESLVTLYLNVAHRVIGYDVATMHDQTGVAVQGQGIVRTALLSGAVGLITAHQHPSGALRPSDADREMWSSLRNMAKAVGVTVLDNLIITQDGFFSEAEG